MSSIASSVVYAGCIRKLSITIVSIYGISHFNKSMMILQDTMR